MAFFIEYFQRGKGDFPDLPLLLQVELNEFPEDAGRGNSDLLHEEDCMRQHDQMNISDNRFGS
ncbi:hypothetical protein IPN35_06650 [Candidatus Peregrinibacteria bacterium]|nr:MAG: hypothetical protein IPN35_06650 [Candidatus Peregrinibacteria bacterium]